MNDPTLSEEAKEKYAAVADKAIAMTESIKHSIVLLQVMSQAHVILYSRGRFMWSLLAISKEITLLIE